jgi:hypothetical protein
MLALMIGLVTIMELMQNELYKLHKEGIDPNIDYGVTPFFNLEHNITENLIRQSFDNFIAFDICPIIYNYLKTNITNTAITNSLNAHILQTQLNDTLKNWHNVITHIAPINIPRCHITTNSMAPAQMDINFDVCVRGDENSHINGRSIPRYLGYIHHIRIVIDYIEADTYLITLYMEEKVTSQRTIDVYHTITLDMD